MYEFYEAFLVLRNPRVLLATCSYAMTFCVASPGISVIIPTTYAAKLGLDEQQIGLQFSAVLIGNVLGEVAATMLSKLSASQPGRPSRSRLWVSYPGFLCIIGSYGLTPRKASDEPD